MKEKKFPIVHKDQHALFTFVERSENNVVICVGNEIVSKIEFKDLKSAKQYVAKKPWELLVNVMCIVNEKMKKL